MPKINTKFGERTRFALWAKDEYLDMVKANYINDNCRTQSEYIEKAIEFYTGFLTSEDNKDYIPKTISSTLKNIVRDTTEKQNRLLFKLTVEIGILIKVFAKAYKIDESYLEELRAEVVSEVKKINGSITLKEAERCKE